MTVVVRPVTARDRPGWERLFVAYGVFYDTSFAADNHTAQRLYDRVATRATWVT